jgi:hypothetical protein
MRGETILGIHFKTEKGNPTRSDSSSEMYKKKFLVKKISNV